VSRVGVHRGLEQLEALTGAVVVLDVFRASNTILSLLAAGAAEVLLLADLDRARALKAAHPAWPLLGERGGLAVPDCDGGNSPAAAPSLVAPGASVILTTSSGTQAVHRLTAAAAVLIASFANAAATVRALHALAPAAITLLPMGLEAREPALEDDLAAEYLAAALAGSPPPFAPLRERLLSCPGADRLRRLGQHDDLEWCTRLDVMDLVPAVTPGDPPTVRSLGSPRVRGCARPRSPLVSPDADAG
jgi:2-phosphosulfolactate phosphatase